MHKPGRPNTYRGDDGDSLIKARERRHGKRKAYRLIALKKATGHRPSELDPKNENPKALKLRLIQNDSTPTTRNIAAISGFAILSITSAIGAFLAVRASSDKPKYLDHAVIEDENGATVALPQASDPESEREIKCLRESLYERMTLGITALPDASTWLRQNCDHELTESIFNSPNPAALVTQHRDKIDRRKNLTVKPLGKDQRPQIFIRVRRDQH